MGGVTANRLYGAARGAVIFSRCWFPVRWRRFFHVHSRHSKISPVRLLSRIQVVCYRKLLRNLGGTMMILRRIGLVVVLFLVPAAQSFSQERVKIAYSSADASNTVWFTALDSGMYRKHGLDVELIFIQSSTMSVSTVVSGDIHVANASGGAVASAVVGGASLVMTACYINTLPYELVVQESVKSAEDLRGKSVGISRVGSASDVAARVLIKGLGLEPVKDVPILQVGGPTERAAAFRTGRIVGFPSP
ncbi:MAG: hypothetical protein GEU77_14085, partial [Deltaproteobacteria bacterium]|nr:hypothetical protein [Deltaproteobacteria bacterium]